jgi:hypothetical protein
VQNIRKIGGGGAAPSGINVATTTAIVLSGLTGEYYSALNGTYTKSGDPASVTAGAVDGQATGAVYFNSAYTGGNRNGAAIWYGPIQGGSSGWQITYYDDNNYILGSIVSANTSIVPVSGYSNAGYTGTITLTAA